MGKWGVLIVDDSELMRQMSSSLFKHDSDFIVSGTACNGQDALDKIKELKPDLVIMDVEMPKMDGLEALRQIMKLHPLPVVMLSSYTSDGSAQTVEAMQSGAVDFFHKDLLFLKSQSERAVKDFLFRCKVAIKSWLATSKLAPGFKVPIYDHLTGLPNRRSFGHMLHDMTYQPQPCFSVLLVDIDHFRLSNDTLGHEVGDRLLQIIAGRLKRFAAEADNLVARIGGDEFILATTECSEEKLAASARQLIQEIARPIQIDSHEVHLTARVGISRFPEDAEDPESLLKFADIAMFHAKEQGTEPYCFYNSRLNEELQRRMAVEVRLRKALDQQEFDLHYQPVINLTTGRLTGVESLIRWTNPELGSVSPQDFIPIAEETGLIHEIGEWVLKQACRQAKAWQDAGFAPVSIAVNLSSMQFYDPKLVETIVGILHETRIQPEQLELEITESMTMNSGTSLSVLRDLKALGVKIAIDDFGTGYSWLGYLKQFPIDKLKIDRSFVQEIVRNQVDAAIVNSIVSMANNLQMHVVAEGVEDEETVSLLKKLGCGMVQGFLFSKPLEADKVSAFFPREDTPAFS